jgi:hypothetical protein
VGVELSVLTLEYILNNNIIFQMDI